MKKILSPLAVLSIVLLFMNCGGDDGPEPGPTPTPTTETVSKTYKVGRNDHYGKGWKGGSEVVKANSNNTNQEIKLSKTVTLNKSSVEKNKSATFDLDSVTIQWNDITVYKEKGVNLTSSTVVNDISNTLDLYSHVATVKGNIEYSKWHAIKGKDTLRTRNSQLGVYTKVILDFATKQKKDTVDLVGVKEGYGKITIPEFIIYGERTYEEDVTFSDGNSEPRVVFKAVNSNTGKTVENLIVKYEGKEIPIDSTFIINRPYGDISLQMIESDSTWINFGDVTFNVKFEYDGQVFVDNTPLENKEIYANLSVDIDDQDNKDLPGVTLSSTGKTAKSNDNGRATINQVVELEPREDKPWLGKPKNIKYDLELDGYNDFTEKTVQVNSGDNVFSEKLTKSTSGNSAEFYVFTRLNGKDLSNLEAKLVNTNDPSISYELTSYDDVIHFPNVVPGEYSLTVSDGEEDDRYENTIVEQIINEGQNKVIVEVTPFKNLVDVTSTVYDMYSLNKLDGQTVYVIKTDGDPNYFNGEHSYYDNEVVYQKVTQSGEVVFEDLVPGIEYHLITEGPNRYRKVNAYFVLSEVTRRSQKQVRKNIASLKKINLPDNSPLTPEIIQTYMTQVFDISFVLGQKPIYLPEKGSEMNQLMQQHFEELAKLLGLPGAFYFVDSPGPKYRDENLYKNPYPNYMGGDNVRVFTPMISNVDQFSGSNTGLQTGFLFNGNMIITHVGIWNIGGLANNFAIPDHEIINGLSKIPQHEKWPTSRATMVGLTSIKDSPEDRTVMPIVFRGAVLHYNTLDSNLELVEYALPVKYEN